MTFIIHYTLPDGTEDSITLTGKTIKEIQEQSEHELKRRGARDPWSKEVT